MVVLHEWNWQTAVFGGDFVKMMIFRPLIVWFHAPDTLLVSAFTFQSCKTRLFTYTHTKTVWPSDHFRWPSPVLLPKLTAIGSICAGQRKKNKSITIKSIHSSSGQSSPPGLTFALILTRSRWINYYFRCQPARNGKKSNNSNFFNFLLVLNCPLFKCVCVVKDSNGATNEAMFDKHICIWNALLCFLKWRRGWTWDLFDLDDCALCRSTPVHLVFEHQIESNDGCWMQLITKNGASTALW